MVEGLHQTIKTERPAIEKVEPMIDYVVTAKGSRYRYLPDGRTQRFKTTEDKDYEPQDALVFVPDYAWVQHNAPKASLGTFGENETQYFQLLLGYVQGQGKKTYIVDAAGKKLETNAEIAVCPGQVFLTFGDEARVEFMIPVARKPKLGFMAYDTRKYLEQGQLKRERHLGNNVVEIKEK